MRFEAKHNFFKHAMARKSYKNVPMSMAYHHSYFSCPQLLLNDGQQGSSYLYSGDTHLLVNLDERPFDILVGLEEAMDEATNAGDISLAIHADRHGIKFAVGNVVCFTTEEGDLPSFGFVTQILIFDENLVFIVQRAITDNFDCNYLAYQIQKINEICIVALEELAHSIPLFPQTISGNVFVNLRHSRVFRA